jgi:hypothetical protein
VGFDEITVDAAQFEGERQSDRVEFCRHVVVLSCLSGCYSRAHHVFPANTRSTAPTTSRISSVTSAYATRSQTVH